MQTAIQLKQLFVTRSEYGADKGQLKGKVEFAGPHGNVELPLDEDTSREIVAICAGAIVRASQQVAQELTADVLTADVLTAETPDLDRLTPPLTPTP